MTSCAEAPGESGARDHCLIGEASALARLGDASCAGLLVGEAPHQKLAERGGPRRKVSAAHRLARARAPALQARWRPTSVQAHFNPPQLTASHGN